MRISIPATSKTGAGQAVVPVEHCSAGFLFRRCSAEHGFGPSERFTEHGFTLLEMLVALAIFSLAGLALVRLQAVSVRTAGDLDARLLAEITARNIAFERITDPAVAGGAGGGTIVNAGREFQWTQSVQPTSDKRIVQITITVTSGPGQSPAVLSIARPLS